VLSSKFNLDPLRASPILWGYSIPQIALIALVLLRLSLKATVEIYDVGGQAASRVEGRRSIGFRPGAE
jgi:hypothetical protein